MRSPRNGATSLRYFFNVQDGITSLDEDGTEFASLNEVRSETLRLAGEILREVGSSFWDHAKWNLWVTDETGLTVLTLTLTTESSDVSLSH
jgi:hypothetical protein